MAESEGKGDRKFIKGAIKHPGALRATAKRMGLISGGNALTHADLVKLARSKNPKTAKRARFAEELGEMRRK